MLRACVLQFDKNWDKYLSLAEFSYNNSYQTSIKMAPFEALYGRRCRTPLSWSQTGERKIFGPDLVMEAEDKVKLIQNNLKAAQSRQKKLRWYTKETVTVSNWRLRISSSLSYPRYSKVRCKREICSSIYRALWSPWSLWTCSLSSATSSSISGHP
jgi:hypothetical protein